MALAIKAENISKMYQIGEIGTGTISRDIERWFAKIRGKEDPFLKIGEANDRSAGGKSDIVWSLKDINFKTEQGERLGIIGRNGAGKSTLLKILSRVTTPTTGLIKIKGRVASLLEVGTGFHPELTGRENIFLNGAILGMRKREIAKKFDEIVAFAGIERYVDTPVKRYSSGMYVRLAFAVAAHLDSEILIVDEVLAVGDAEFQKKCLSKMGDVSKSEGRTILFVSHNMQAIQNLCTRAILLQDGCIVNEGIPGSVVNDYLKSEGDSVFLKTWNNPEEAPGNAQIKLKKIELIPQYQHKEDIIDIRTPLTLKFELWNFDAAVNLMAGLHLFTLSDECIFDVPSEPEIYSRGIIKGTCEIPGNFLNDGPYYLSLILTKDTSKMLYYFEKILSFEVEDYRELAWYGKWMGHVRPKFNFSMEMKSKELETG